MKVLITGVAGFLGTHVAELFTEKGWNVVGIDNLSTYEIKRTGYDSDKVRQHNVDFLNKLGIDFRVEDVRSFEPKNNEIFDLIIHCAAQPAMTIAIENPELDGDNNIMGTLYMLKVAEQQGAPFINCSSVHVYGNASNANLIDSGTRFTKVPAEINEKTPILQGNVTPLHVSKRATELYTQSFSETYNIRAASFRFTGMYGERQFGGMDHGWVANFAIRTIMGKEITIFGTDLQVRDILYAKDAAMAFLKWYEQGDNGIYNIGGGIENSVSINECLEELRKITKKKQNIVFEGTRFGDMYYFVCDYTKAKSFGWKPTVRPEEGLKRLVKWAKANKELL